jgi:hypothetical protein
MSEYTLLLSGECSSLGLISLLDKRKNELKSKLLMKEKFDELSARLKILFENPSKRIGQCFRFTIFPKNNFSM